MKTLTTQQFNNYVNTLIFISECGHIVYATDGNENICYIDIRNSKCEFKTPYIDEEQYELTEFQKQVLSALTETHLEDFDPPEVVGFTDFITNIYN